ncbi:hypothetical protein POSPLADRAFT_1058814 [Postia placenta MAD-698-R-SB12]|uniref:Uncharacterized protein n=1 Tax=Postia placenta MAD-698-R-SB12 TaxID=670580 RepID=A0A1X6MW91_9APHY|nr:hypothetical protein POSPLADRAFT_1058814 [Postia placenta MAD-698-R-SB12]OSX60638.1 hypothetical protein POSPLADRAFT_1058814 [Postia placenta MAD-698-R-SB12]
MRLRALCAIRCVFDPRPPGADSPSAPVPATSTTPCVRLHGLGPASDPAPLLDVTCPRLPLREPLPLASSVPEPCDLPPLAISGPLQPPSPPPPSALSRRSAASPSSSSLSRPRSPPVPCLCPSLFPPPSGAHAVPSPAALRLSGCYSYLVISLPYPAAHRHVRARARALRPAGSAPCSLSSRAAVIETSPVRAAATRSRLLRLRVHGRAPLCSRRRIHVGHSHLGDPAMRCGSLALSQCGCSSPAWAGHDARAVPGVRPGSRGPAPAALASARVVAGGVRWPDARRPVKSIFPMPAPTPPPTCLRMGKSAPPLPGGADQRFPVGLRGTAVPCACRSACRRSCVPLARPPALPPPAPPAPGVVLFLSSRCNARPRMPAAFPAQAWRGGHLDDARGEILQMAATPPGCPIDTRVGVRGMRQFASAKAPAFPCTAILLARSETAIWSHPRPSQREGNEAPSDAFPSGPPARRLQSARPSPSRFAGDLVQRLQAPHSQAPPPSSTLFPGAARSALARACVAALS